MSLDRALAILGAVLGLPGFFALFFLPSLQIAAGVALVCSAAVLGMAWWIHRRLERSPFTMKSVDVALKFEDGPKRARLVKVYSIVANYPQQRSLLHRNIGADGPLSDFRWDGSQIPSGRIRNNCGLMELAIDFNPAPTPGRPFPGRLEYVMQDSFKEATESLEYAVDFPTESLSITIEFPPSHVCTGASARHVFGGLESPMDGLQNHTQSLNLRVDKPRIGSQIQIHWQWTPAAVGVTAAASAPSASASATR